MGTSEEQFASFQPDIVQLLERQFPVAAVRESDEKARSDGVAESITVQVSVRPKIVIVRVPALDVDLPA